MNSHMLYELAQERAAQFQHEAEQAALRRAARRSRAAGRVGEDRHSDGPLARLARQERARRRHTRLAVDAPCSD